MISTKLSTPIGYLTLEASCHQLEKISFLDSSHDSVSMAKEISHPILDEYVKCLLSYFYDKIPIPAENISIPSGTLFQKKVWKALLNIPFGQTCTYGVLAERLQTSARAVGNACRENPLPIIIPCHRVVAKTGLGGYSGFTQGEKMNIKCWLLKHEGVQI